MSREGFDIGALSYFELGGITVGERVVDERGLGTLISFAGRGFMRYWLGGKVSWEGRIGLITWDVFEKD